MTTANLTQLASQWSRFRLIRDLAQALAVGLVAGAFVVGWSVPGGVGLAIFVAAVVAWSRRPRWEVSAASLAAHLDRSYAELEESASLWLRPVGDLTLLEHLQRRRLDAAWTGLIAANPRAGLPPERGLRMPRKKGRKR